MFSINDNNKIGIILVMAGISAYFLGLIFFFDRSLLLIGNLCFLIGIATLIGFFGAISFFTKKGKMKASLFFFLGFFVIIIRFSIIGCILQIYGLLSLFRSFIPHLFEWIMSVPGIGPALKHNRFFNKLYRFLDDRAKPKI